MPVARHVGLCPEPDCGRARFVSRKRARKAARDRFPSRHLTAYQCGEYWHYGPPAETEPTSPAAQIRAIWAATHPQPSNA